MRYFVLAAASLIVAATALLTVGSAAQAGAYGSLAVQNGPDGSALIHKIGSGCGWDYACPPRPNYGRSVTRNENYQRARTQFNIQNYGNVHINYYDGHRPVHKHVKKRRPKYSYRHHYRHCDHYGCRRCGPNCWYRKFKSGYCGHGCEFYKEKVEFETAYRKVRTHNPVIVKKDYDHDDYHRRDHYPRTVHKRPRYPVHCDDDDC